MFKLLRSVVRRSLLSEKLSRKEICVNFQSRLKSQVTALVCEKFLDEMEDK